MKPFAPVAIAFALIASGVPFATDGAAQTTARVKCADPSTPGGLREIDNGAPECGKRKPVPRPIRPAERAKVIAAADVQLKDGASARWRFEPVRADLVCGYVNAKNSFGAYVGWQPFSAWTDGRDFTIYSNKDRWLFETLCHGAAVPAD